MKRKLFLFFSFFEGVWMSFKAKTIGDGITKDKSAQRFEGKSHVAAEEDKKANTREEAKYIQHRIQV